MPKKAGPPRKKVLIIEDDDDVSKVFRRLLKPLDVDVVIAGDGRTGLRMARDEKPDLVLLDLHLPRMNGIEVIRSIRATPTLAGLPLIVVTGSSTVETLRETVRAGAEDFLVKANVLAGGGLDRIRKFLGAPPRRK